MSDLLDFSTFILHTVLVKVPYVKLLKGHLIRIRPYSDLTTFVKLDKHCITVLYSQLLNLLTDVSSPIRADKILTQIHILSSP